MVNVTELLPHAKQKIHDNKNAFEQTENIEKNNFKSPSQNNVNGESNLSSITKKGNCYDTET